MTQSEQHTDSVIADLIEALREIYVLPLHPCDDARNAACLQKAKNLAQDAIAKAGVR